MADIILQELNLTRGDTGFFSFPRKDAEGNLITTAPREMYFTIRLGWNAPTVIVQKTLADMTFGEDNHWHVVIEPEDTETLAYHTYVWDVEVKDGYTKTIAKGILNLTEEATWHDMSN